MEIQRPYGREAVRRALVQAATSLIAKHGVEGVSTRTIAKEAQVNHGLITRHFGSKEGLVKEVAATIGRQLFQEVLYNEENLEAAWNRGFADHSEIIKALIRIALDTEDSAGDNVGDDFLRDMTAWIRGQEQNRAKTPSYFSPSDAKICLISALVFGSELIAPSIKRGLGMDEAKYAKLRAETFKLAMRGFQNA